MMKNAKAGFTLAEVLTTLMVIGVVAAMTIPTLLNSTNDQQSKVAFKKAMSILSQGTQLMVAKEEECSVTTSAELANCFKENVLSGSVVSWKGGNASGDTKNVITTSDGIAYAFYYTGDATDSSSRSLDSICGDISDVDDDSDVVNHYNGKNAKCFILVDLNGLSKGSKAFSTSGQTGGSELETSAFLTAGLASNSDLVNALGDDQTAVMLFGDGVRPMYVTGADDLNKGYEWMYGETDPTSSST